MQDRQNIGSGPVELLTRQIDNQNFEMTNTDTIHDEKDRTA
jgi:hypothetical protein